MIKFSEATAIALHSAIIIAKNKDGYTPLPEIEKELRVSKHHLSKVLQRLQKSGLVESVKGPKGGFKLSKSKKQISYLDIYEAMEGKFIPCNCLFSKRKLSCKNCIMGDFLKDGSKEFLKYMSTTKIK